MAPVTPPTTAPIGPATRPPSAAPAIPPAVCLETAGRFSLVFVSPDAVASFELDDPDSFAAMFAPCFGGTDTTILIPPHWNLRDMHFQCREKIGFQEAPKAENTFSAAR